MKRFVCQQHSNESERLNALCKLQILDTPLEERFERITRLACTSFDVPICSISCVDLHRQWFKSIQGMNADQTERSISFCQHAILQDNVLVVPDARLDERFASSPLVTGKPGIVFYAGAPVFSEDNLPVATLCVIDTRPRSFTHADRDSLRAFARIVEQELKAARTNRAEDALIHEVGESWRSAMIDPLTRLWNHEGTALLLTEALRVQSPDTPMGAAIIELGAYDEIHRGTGHIQSDAYLREFAKRALRVLDEGDCIGRLHQAQFVIHFPNIDAHEQMLETLHRLSELARECAPNASSQNPTIGYGLWFSADACVDQPEQVLGDLADGLESVRGRAGEPIEIQPFVTRAKQSEAA